MQSDATTVEAYLSGLPEDRKDAIAAVRHLVLENLPHGYEEAMDLGMITYRVPMKTSGPTYNGRPLMFAGIASQRKYMTVHLMGLYCLPGLKDRFERAYADAGMKLDMGKGCVRFRSLDELNRDAVADVIRSVPVEDFVTAAPPPKRRRGKAD